MHVGSPGILTKVTRTPSIVPQSYRSHGSSGLGYGDLTELTDVPGTVRKCYRTHRSSRYCGTGVQNLHKYIYDHSFWGDLMRSFFPPRPQYAILGTGILGQIASFERRRRGAAQTPLSLPYAFRTWPGSSTWTARDKREVRDLLYFGRYTPELFLDLGICRA